MSGILYVCATPIGNLGDASARLRAVFSEVDIVFAEDTRRTGRLLEHLGVSVPLRSYFAGNESERAVELKARIADGERIALVSDAGTPAISDPGLSAVMATLSAGGDVVPVPGPSAVTTLLAVSGLPSDRFVFEGFIPRKGSARTDRLEAMAHETRTVVFFTTGKRLTDDLFDLAEAGVDGWRPVVIGRELTKLHEEIWRGALGEALTAEHDPRGEVTVALAGAEPIAVTVDEAVRQAADLVEAGQSVKSAAAEVAGETGVSRRKIYERLIRRN